VVREVIPLIDFRFLRDDVYNVIATELGNKKRKWDLGIIANVQFVNEAHDMSKLNIVAYV